MPMRSDLGSFFASKSPVVHRAQFDLKGFVEELVSAPSQEGHERSDFAEALEDELLPGAQGLIA